MVPRKCLVRPDHLPYPLLIERDPGVLCDPGGVQDVDKFVRQLLCQHIVEPADAVAAGGQDDALVVPRQHILQHALGEAAYIGVHLHVRLGEVGHLRLDPLHLHAHGPKDLYGRVFTDIS